MALIETACLLAGAVFLLYMYITRNHSYWAKRNIRYEKPAPFFGNYFDNITMKRNPGQIIADLYSKYKGEKVVGVFNYMRPALMVRDPGLVSRIFTTDFHHFADNDFNIDEDLDPVMSRNIFFQKGDKWKRNRQALSPAFTVGKIKTTYDKIRTISGKLVKYLENNPEVEVKSTMSLYTSEIVAGWGIGIDGHSFDSPDPILPKLGKMIFEPTLRGMISFAIIAFNPTIGKLLRIKFVPDEVPQFFNNVLRDIINSRSSSDNTQHKDFLQYFMDLKKKRMISKNDDQNDVSDNDIISGIVSFFVEGYETSSIVLSFLLYHLTMNVEVQKKLRTEVDELYSNSSNDPTLEEISELPLLSRVYSETVRLHGTLVLNKVCTVDCSLDLGDGKSLKVEKGTGIVIPLSGIHCDPDYWPQPEKFDPDRFRDDVTHPKGTYLPFGDGPRICIGMRIASAMIKTAVADIVKNFELLPTKKTAPKYVQDPRSFMSAMEGGIHIKFLKRS